MINRNPLVCLSCDTKVITRTQIGHSESQTHAFACPRCGVQISFTIDLDQKKASLKYREPKNARWAESEDDAAATLTFSDEIPVAASGEGFFSPFLSTVWNLEDRESFGRDEGLRMRFVKKDFDFIERCRIHYEKGDWDLFDKQSPPDDPASVTVRKRLVHLYSAIQAGMSLFTRTPSVVDKRVLQRVKYARSLAPALVADLAEIYLVSGRMLKLWKEAAVVRSQFVGVYDTMQPLIQMTYWRKELQDLNTFKVSTKRFDALRQLYIDTFETLCRFLVVAGAHEGIILRNSLGIPTTKRIVPVDEFENFKNAVKRDVISNLPIGDLFVGVLDTDLRNGIGHNSAHYESDTDTVILYDTKAAATVSQSMPYTEFCSRTLNLFAAFELGAMYFQFLHLTADGRLS